MTRDKIFNLPLSSAPCCCYLAGIFDEFQYSVEQQLVEKLLLDNGDEFHLKEFLTQWNQLNQN